VFLSSYRNTSGSLGEREMLWEHEPRASVSRAFSSSVQGPVSRKSRELKKNAFPGPKRYLSVDFIYADAYRK